MWFRMTRKCGEMNRLSHSLDTKWPRPCDRHKTKPRRSCNRATRYFLRCLFGRKGIERSVLGLGSEQPCGGDVLRTADWTSVPWARARLFLGFFFVCKTLVRITRAASALCCLCKAVGTLRVRAAHAMRHVLRKHQQRDEQRFEVVAIPEHRCRPWQSTCALPRVKEPTACIGLSLQGH